MWVGGGVGKAEVGAAIDAVTTSDERAHDLCEGNGRRRALLLVHGAAEEREGVVRVLEPLWACCFLNEVHDLAHSLI